MSLCNVWFGDEVAIATVDTAGLGKPSKQQAPFSKVVALPHAGTLFAYRGERFTFLALHTQIFASYGLDGFDEIKATIRPMFERIDREMKDASLPDGVDLTLELFVIGWSVELRRMAVARFLYQPGEALEEKLLLDRNAWLSPCEDEDHDAAYMIPFREHSSADYVDFANKQITFGRATSGDGYVFGGRLLKATVQRHSVTIEDLGEVG